MKNVKNYSIIDVTRARTQKSVILTLSDNRQIPVGNTVINDFTIDLDVGFRAMKQHAPAGAFELRSEGELVAYKEGDDQYSWDSDTKKSVKNGSKHTSDGWEVPRNTFPVIAGTPVMSNLDLSRETYKPLRADDGTTASAPIPAVIKD